MKDDMKQYLKERRYSLTKYRTEFESNQKFNTSVQVIDENNFQQQLHQKSLITNKLTDSLQNLFETKINKQRQSIDLLRKKGQKVKGYEYSNIINSNIDMTAVPEQSMIDRTKQQDRQILNRIDCAKTSNTIYPVKMDQILDQRVQLKDIKQDQNIKKKQLEQLDRAIQQEDDKLKEFINKRDKVMQDYVDGQNDVKKQEDVLTIETICNNGLIRMIDQIKSDIIIYENRNKDLQRYVQKENDNIDYLDNLNINSLKNLEENHQRIYELIEEQNKRQEVMNRRAKDYKNFMQNEDQAQKYLIFEQKLENDQNNNTSMRMINERKIQLDEQKQEYETIQQVQNELKLQHQDYQSKIHQILSIAGKLNQTLTKEQLKELKENYDSLLSFLENKKGYYEQRIVKAKKELNELQMKYDELDYEYRNMNEQIQQQLDKEFECKNNSETTKYHLQMDYESLHTNQQTEKIKKLININLRMNNYFQYLQGQAKKILEYGNLKERCPEAIQQIKGLGGMNICDQDFLSSITELLVNLKNH